MDILRGLHDLHADAHILKGKEHLEAGNSEAALKEFLTADTYPENQMIERSARYRGNARVYYYTGLAHEVEGDMTAAKEFYTKAISQQRTGNEYLYYKAMAHLRKGERGEAQKIFEQMIELGENRLEDSGETDFFAKFGGDLTENQHKAVSCRIIGLGYLGQNKLQKAREFLSKSLEYDANQLWSKVYLAEL